MATTGLNSDAAQAGSQASLHSPAYRNYVLGVLLLGYIVNVMDRGVLALLLPAIKTEFQASDTQLGLLGGMAFAAFYATFGIFIAALADRVSRRSVLSVCILVWSSMTALCGLAVNFTMLVAARIGTAIGEAGGSPPSHSLISDYFPLGKRATALSIYALGVPIGGMLGSLLGGWGNELYGWRAAFMLVGLPGILVALLVRFTIKEPPRGLSDSAVATAGKRADAPPLLDALQFLWTRTSFRHLTLAAGLHSFVWYGGSTFNATFLVRSHEMSTGEAGSLLAGFQLIGAAGTFLGGYLSDRMSVARGDRRWYMWVPGVATLVMVPFQFSAYLSPGMALVIPSFCVMVVLGSFFFGPSFAMTQALATLRVRAVATSVLLFIQTAIGLGLGPVFVGIISDHLEPTHGVSSLAWGLVIVGLVNIWAAVHYFWGARSLRQDLESTENLSRSSGG